MRLKCTGCGRRRGVCHTSVVDPGTRTYIEDDVICARCLGLLREALNLAYAKKEEKA